MPRKRKVQHPCVVCDKAAGCGTIQCNLCTHWVHKQCVPLTADQFSDYSNSEKYFLCITCVKGETDEFDYSRSLARSVLLTKLVFNFFVAVVIA